MSNFHLTVVRPFGNYVRGSHITDDAAIETILASGNSANVVKVSKPVANKPDPVPLATRHQV